ncbi:hypothetical protein AC1031_012645 [Aphanomyces cochlioides]|nr:hypothetical protein AC1031_012645 [Aphanomyces cochlioides]
MRYDSAQVAILPQFIPFTKCVTMNQIELLSERLRNSTKSALFTLDEFNEWLTVGSYLQVYLRYVFDSLKSTPTSSRVHVMDFLAAMVVCTSTCPSITEKIELLCTLFTHKYAPTLKESDIAIIMLSTINGLKKVTIGLEDTWNISGKTTHDIAKDLTTASCTYMIGCTPTMKSVILREDFVAWCLGYKPVLYVLRHFIPGDILNPTSVLAHMPFYGKVSSQAKLYETLLDEINPVGNEQIESLLQTMATIKIQSMWKRHRAQQVLEAKRHTLLSRLNFAAAKIQDYVKKKRNFLTLMQRAAMERMSLNGALLTFGSGICVGTGDVTEKLPRSADMVAELKLQSVRTRRAFMSSSCTFVDTNNGWMMWGQCLPMHIGDTKSTSFLHKFPIHVDLKVDIASVACGRGHCLLLDKEGMVHSWGWHDHGQTGHSSSKVFSVRNEGASYQTYYDERTRQMIPFLDKPLKLPYFTGDVEQDAVPIPIQQIAAGEFFSVVLSTDGQVYSWGEGSDGQLGIGVDCAFDVGYVDKRLEHSAFTFTDEPKAIPMLSNVHSIAVYGNRCTALTKDHRVFEWGAWKRLLGEEVEPSFVPQEREGVKSLGFYKIAIGAEHTIAEGASVWLRLPQKETNACFVMLAEHACSIDAVRQLKNPVQVVALDFNFDDFQDDQADLPRPTSLSRADQDTRMSSISSTAESVTDSEIERSIDELLDQLWVNRAQEVIPSLEKMKCMHPSVKALQWPQAVKNGSMSYDDIIDEIMIDIAGRVTCFKLCLPEGFYFELITGDTIVFEVPVCPTSTTRRITNRGIWAPLASISSNPVDVTGLDNRIVFTRFSPDDLIVKTTLLRVDNIVDCISASLAQKVIALQEAGAIAVVAGFDFHGTAPFVVEIPVDQGLYIPVVLLEMPHFEAAQASIVQCPDAEARLFHRTDNTPGLIRSALQHGASGVLLQQRQGQDDVSAFDGDLSKGDPFIYPHPFDVDAPFVGMVSFSHGEIIRNATHLDLTNHMVVAAQIQVEPRGHFYAWGCAANGRLGIGAMTNTHLVDGFDARTDAPYRCAKSPVVVPALCGRDIVDFVCGSAHTLARTRSGRLFTWGRGSAGQLGHPDTLDRYVPTLVTRFAYEVIVEIAANDVCSTVVYESLPTERYDQRRKEISLLKAAKIKC